jgi:hypothetical protein
VEFSYGSIRSRRHSPPWNYIPKQSFALGQEGNFRALSADDERDAEHWRRLEAEARTVAATMTDPKPRRIMLFIADGYKLLADRAEFRKTQKD